MPLASTDRPSRKTKRKAAQDPLDIAIMEHLNTNRSPSPKDLDEEGHFALHVAARLRKLEGRKKALATLKMQQALTEVEYGFEFYPSGGPQQHQPANYFQTALEQNNFSSSSCAYPIFSQPQSMSASTDTYTS